MQNEAFGHVDQISPGFGWKDSGVRYCVAHEGLIDVDQDVCDFNRSRHNRPSDCVSRKLFYWALEKGE